MTRWLRAAFIAAAGMQCAVSVGSTLDAKALGVQPRMIEWRRDFHEHPELSNREFHTSKRVAAHLKSLGLEVRTGIAHTGVVGVLKGKLPGPTIALRADMDALPVTENNDLPFRSRVTSTYRGESVGVMHACGHDAHTAILMAAATVLASLRNSLPGVVLFVFQPAEEGAPEGETGGASLMLEEGVFGEYQPAAMFGLHVIAGLPVGSVAVREGALMAASDAYRIVVDGRQTHGARPWAGIDPIMTSAQIIYALQTIVSRQVNIVEYPAVISVGAIKGGIRNNIIPDSVEMLGTLRTFDTEQRTQIMARMQRIVETTAGANEAKATLSFAERGNPVVHNDEALVRAMRPALVNAVGESQVITASPVTGSEDFAYFAQQTPSMYFFVGISAAGAAAAPNHSDRFHIDEAGLTVGLRALLHVAMQRLSQPTH